MPVKQTEALERYEEVKPRVIILDILLPQMNGLEFIHKIKTSKTAHKSAVIMISALGYREGVQQAIEAGSIDFLINPFEMDVLAARVRQALDEGV